MNSKEKDIEKKKINELLPSNLVSEFDIEINEEPKNDESDFSSDEEVDVIFFYIFYLFYFRI